MKTLSLYKSAEGKEEILSIYDQKLKDLNIAYESFDVNTSFGRTHVLKTGQPTNPPLLLFHGANGCAPIALACYPNLSSAYQVYAVDVLAQPNKSAETRLSMKDESYGQWVHELIDALGLDDVVLAGFSFGGLIILKTLSYSQESIKSAFLASPAYIVNGNPLAALFKVFIPMKRYMRTYKNKYIEKFLAVLFTERDDFAMQYLSEVFRYFKMDFSPVPVIHRSEALSISTPITILGAGKDIFFPGRKMKRRVNKIFPSLKRFVLLEDSRHVQDVQGNKLFEYLIMQD